MLLWEMFIWSGVIFLIFLIAFIVSYYVSKTNISEPFIYNKLISIVEISGTLLSIFLILALAFGFMFFVNELANLPSKPQISKAMRYDLIRIKQIEKQYTPNSEFQDLYRSLLLHSKIYNNSVKGIAKCNDRTLGHVKKHWHDRKFGSVINTDNNLINIARLVEYVESDETNRDYEDFYINMYTEQYKGDMR